MHHTVALAASLVSLGLIAAIYQCNILSRPRSLLRSEMLGMILLALVTGIFPVAVAATAVGLFEDLSGGLSIAALVASASDLVSVAAIVASLVLFRSLLKATYRAHHGPTDVKPPSPQPVNTNRRPAERKAA